MEAFYFFSPRINLLIANIKGKLDLGNIIKLKA